MLDAGAFESPSTKQAAGALAKWDGPRPTLVALADDEVAAAKSFRNLAGMSVLPADAVGVSDLVAAASLLVSEAALHALTTRGKGRRRETAGEAA